jgi:uroporphyrinogen-III synthase
VGSLAGVTVLVTRRPEQAGEFAAAIRRLGAEVEFLPLVDIAPPVDWAAADRAVKDLAQYGAVAFTSANAVEMFLNRVDAAGIDRERVGDRPLFAVGGGTGRALAESGLAARVPPEASTGERLAEWMLASLPEGVRVLFPCGDIARETLTERLTSSGRIVDRVVVYRTVAPDLADAQGKLDALRAGKYQVVTFTSPSAARNFATLIDPMVLADVARSIVAAAIGPTTAEALAALGIRPAIVARRQSVVAFAEEIAGYFSRRDDGPVAGAKESGRRTRGQSHPKK